LPVGEANGEGEIVAVGDTVLAGDNVAEAVGCAVGEGRGVGVAVALGETDCVGEPAEGRGDGETVGEIELAGFAVAACKLAVGCGFPAPPPGGGFGLGEEVGISGGGVIGRGVIGGGDCGFGEVSLGEDGVGVGDPFDLSGFGWPTGWPAGGSSPKSSSSTRRIFITQLGCASALDVLPYSSESPLHL